MLKKIIYPLVLLFIISCNNTNQNKADLTDVINCNIKTYEQIQGQNPLFGEPFFIPMETDKNNILGSVKLFEANNEYIFIGDDQKVICFEIDDNFEKGNIKYIINSVGKGPGEYAHVADIAFNDRYLFIFDERKVNYYDLNSGKFINTINLDFVANEVAALDNYLIFYSYSFQNKEAYKYELVVLNIENNEIQKYFKHSDKHLGSVEGKQLAKCNNELYYSCLTRNVIYRFDENAVPQSYLLLSSDDNNKVIDHIANANLNDVNDLKSGDYYYHFSNFLKINNYWTFQFSNKGQGGYFYINVKSPEDGYISGSTVPRAVYKGVLISPVDSWQISKGLESLNEYENDSTTQNAYSRVLNVNENDNPCLRVFKINE